MIYPITLILNVIQRNDFIVLIKRILKKEILQITLSYVYLHIIIIIFYFHYYFLISLYFNCYLHVNNYHMEHFFIEESC